VKSLVIGMGQIGVSLYNVLKETHEVYIRDIDPIDVSGVEVIHLCFPYSDNFIEQADAYYELYKPKLVINHASVAVGTTEKLKGPVCYSPMRGRHPHLEESILTFDKYIAANDPVIAMAAYNYFRVVRIPCKIIGDMNGMRLLEFSKLVSNIHYGYNIVFMQEMTRIADSFDIDIDGYLDWERSYNKGYRQLHEPEKQRSILYGGICGGHCIRPCNDILNAQYPSIIFEDIKKLDDKKRQEQK